MVIDRVQAVVEAGERVGDGGAVPGPLDGLLVIQGPGGRPGADDEPGGGLEEQMPSVDTVDTGGPPVAEHDDAKAVDAGDRVEIARRRRGDSLAVCTRRWPANNSPSRVCRASLTAPVGTSTTVTSMTLARSLSSLKAHMTTSRSHSEVWAVVDRWWWRCDVVVPGDGRVDAAAGRPLHVLADGFSDDLADLAVEVELVDLAVEVELVDLAVETGDAHVGFGVLGVPVSVALGAQPGGLVIDAGDLVVGVSAVLAGALVQATMEGRPLRVPAADAASRAGRPAAMTGATSPISAVARGVQDTAERYAPRAGR